MGKVVKDPVHGYISLSEEDLEIIDTPYFQRLKRIRQLPAEVVYPGATHSRFEHSLGVMMLSDFIFQTLKKQIQRESMRGRRSEATKILMNEEKYRNTLHYAGLLHDVGHTPLSHVCERFGEDATEVANILQNYGISIKPKGGGAKHEWTSCAIALKYLGDKLRKKKVDLELFCRMICGCVYREGENKEFLNPLIQIINSPIDADKLDYILRDSYMTGAILANLDHERFVQSYTMRNNKLAISKQGLSIATQLIHGRESLYLWLYTHNAVTYYQNLIQRYVSHLINLEPHIKNLFSVQSLAEEGVDDHRLYSLLHQHKGEDDYTARLSNQIFGRDFYKTLWKNPFQLKKEFSEEKIIQLVMNLEQVEQAIVKDLALPQFSVFAYEASFRVFNPFRQNEEEETSLKNILVGVSEQDFELFESLFQERIYKLNPKILGTVPYIRVERQVYEMKKDEIIEWLLIKRYQPIKLP